MRKAMDISNLGLPEMSSRLRSGEITAKSLTTTYLERIQRYDTTLKAYECVNHAAIEQAHALDALRESGTYLGPLMGMPVAVKDLIHVDGMPTRVGSLLDVSPSFSAHEGPLITRLRLAGCVILGKTRTAEFALSSSGINYRNGTPINPWDCLQARVPGGSSSGSAVAVAADMCAFAIGTDTGGSVRTPAAYCGVVGIKFAGGAIDADGSFPLSPTLDSFGVLTRRVACAEMIAEVLGLRRREAQQHHALVLGIPSNLKKVALDPAVERCWHEALERIKSAGHSVHEVCIDDWHSDLDPVYSSITRAEVFATLASYLNSKTESLVNPEILRKLRSGSSIDAITYILAVRRRHALIKYSEGLFEHFDGLITPTKPTVAPTYPATYAGTTEDDRVLAKTGVLTREANVLNMTAASLPIHQLGSDLPVGLQLLCRGDDLGKLLKLAGIVEQCVGNAERPNIESFLR